jgi:hypothetical protein
MNPDDLNTNEDIVEAIDENGQETNSILEASLEQSVRNGSISEQQLETQDRILQELQKEKEDDGMAGFFSALEMVKGKDSTVPGPKGETGEKGDTGDKGEDGEQGERGEQGLQGEQGIDGNAGKQGEAGQDGTDGAKGKDGKKGSDGSPDTPKQVKEKLFEVGIGYDELTGLPDIAKIARMSIASKTVSLIELDDIDYSALTKNAEGKYILGGGGGSSDNLYNINGQLTGARTVDQDGNDFLMTVDALGYSGTLEFIQTERFSAFKTKSTDRTKEGGFFNSIDFGGIHSAIIQAFDYGTGEAASVKSYSDGTLTLSATSKTNLKTEAVNASTATVGQVLTLQDASTGELEYADAPSDKSEYIIIGASDETTALTTGTAKTTFRIPWTGTITGVRASVTTAPTDAVLTVDINKTGTGTILSTKITIDPTEKTSVTAAIAPVISTAGVTDDDEYTIDIDTIGSTVAGTGLKITILGTRS